MILSYVCLALAALSLVALGICAGMGIKLGKNPEAVVEDLTPWLKRCLISGVCLLVFGCAYLVLTGLGVGL